MDHVYEGAGTGNGQDPSEVKLPTGSSASPGLHQDYRYLS